MVMLCCSSSSSREGIAPMEACARRVSHKGGPPPHFHFFDASDVAATPAGRTQTNKGQRGSYIWSPFLMTTAAVAVSLTASTIGAMDESMPRGAPSSSNHGVDNSGSSGSNSINTAAVDQCHPFCVQQSPLLSTSSHSPDEFPRFTRGSIFHEVNSIAVPSLPLSRGLTFTSPLLSALSSSFPTLCPFRFPVTFAAAQSFDTDPCAVFSDRSECLGDTDDHCEWWVSPWAPAGAGTDPSEDGGDGWGRDYTCRTNCSAFNGPAGSASCRVRSAYCSMAGSAGSEGFVCYRPSRCSDVERSEYRDNCLIAPECRFEFSRWDSNEGVCVANCSKHTAAQCRYLQKDGARCHVVATPAATPAAAPSSEVCAYFDINDPNSTSAATGPSSSSGAAIVTPCHLHTTASDCLAPVAVGGAGKIVCGWYQPSADILSSNRGATGFCAVNCTALSPTANGGECTGIGGSMCDVVTSVDDFNGRQTSQCAPKRPATLTIAPICTLLMGAKGGVCPSYMCNEVSAKGTPTQCGPLLCDGFTAADCPTPFCSVNAVDNVCGPPIEPEPSTTTTTGRTMATAGEDNSTNATSTIFTTTFTSAADNNSSNTTSTSTTNAAEITIFPTNNSTTATTTTVPQTAPAPAPSTGGSSSAPATTPAPTKAPEATTTTPQPTGSDGTPKPADDASCSAFSSNAWEQNCPYDRCYRPGDGYGCLEACPRHYAERCPGDDGNLCAYNSRRDCGMCEAPLVQCWNSECVTMLSQCPCRDPAATRCPFLAGTALGDGVGCVRNLSTCAAIAASITAACPKGTVRCPEEALCRATVDECPCPSVAPIRCYGSSARQCAVTVHDCGQTCPVNAPAVEDTTITASSPAALIAPSTVCWDGSCAISAGMCPCPPRAPIRCPMNTTGLAPMCVVAASECPCPTGTLRCGSAAAESSGGSANSTGCVKSCSSSQRCAISAALCADGTCPEEGGGVCRCTDSLASAAVIRLAINATSPLMNLAAHQDIRLQGAVSYRECSVDLSSRVNLSWALYDGKGRVVTITGKTDAASLLIPAYTLPTDLAAPQWYRLVLSAYYVSAGGSSGTLRVAKKASAVLFLSITPTRPTVRFLSGSVLTVSVGQPFDLALEVMRPCSGNLCTAGGFRSYSCDGDCPSDLVVTCRSSASRNGGCGTSFTDVRTLYRDVVLLSEATYYLSATFGTSDTQQLMIHAVHTTAANAALILPTVTIRCIGRYTTESVNCIAVASRREYGIAWYWRSAADGDVRLPQFDNQLEMSLPLTTLMESIVVKAKNLSTTMEAEAEHFVYPVTLSVVCSHSVVSGPANFTESGFSPGLFPPIRVYGLSTKMQIVCDVGGLHNDDLIKTSLEYRVVPTVDGSTKMTAAAVSALSPTPLTPFPLLTPRFFFTVPAVKGLVEIVANVWSGLEGRIIASVVVEPTRLEYPNVLNISFDAAASSLTSLETAVQAAKDAKDMTAAISTIAALGDAVRSSAPAAGSGGGTPPPTADKNGDATANEAATRQKSALSTVLGAVGSLWSASTTQSPSWFPGGGGGGGDLTATPMSSAQAIVVAKTVSELVASPLTPLDDELIGTASKVLQNVARVAAMEGGASLQASMLAAVGRLGPSIQSDSVTMSVAKALVGSAPLGGNGTIVTSERHYNSSGGSASSSSVSPARRHVVVSGTRFISTDSGSRSVSIGGHSATMHQRFSFYGTPDVTVLGGMSGMLSPAAFASDVSGLLWPPADADADTGAPVGRITTTARPSSSDHRHNLTLVSDIVRFSLYFDGNDYALFDTLPINISIAINVTALEGGLLLPRRAVDGDEKDAQPLPPDVPSSSPMIYSVPMLFYWNEVDNAWSRTGIETLGPCADNPTTHLCGTTTHFTAFGVFAVAEPNANNNGGRPEYDDDDSNSLPYIVGGVVAGVFFIAVATIVAMKINHARREALRQRNGGGDGTGDYNASQFDLSHDPMAYSPHSDGGVAATAALEMRLLPPPSSSQSGPAKLSQTDNDRQQASKNSSFA